MKTIPIKKFTAGPDALLRQLKAEKTTLLTDADGSATAYLVDPGAFDAFQARMQLLEGIARGEKAIREGRVFSHSQAKKKMARWLKNK